MAVVTAMFGFSYSIVTQADSAKSTFQVQPRAVGSTTIRILAPAYTPIPTDFDLGDALFGTVITRYVTATGGLRPYNFSAPGLGGLLGATSTLSVLTSGCVLGSAAFSTTQANLTFTVSVTGSTETDVNNTPVPSSNQTFHLTLFPTGAQLFRFANDHLNNGVLGQPYIGKVDTIGGKGTVKYTIVPGTVTLNGLQVGTGNSLEDSLGLSMSIDGTVYGKPLQTGLVTFTAQATDSIKRIAKDRTNSIPNQVFAFNIEDTRITATDATTLSISVKGDTSKLNTDSLKFHAFMNLSGANTTGLKNQQFAFIFGGNTYVGFMNDSGVVGTQLGAPLVFPDGTLLKAKVDSVNGTITGTLTRANLTQGLDAVNIVNRSTKRVGVNIQIRNMVVASDTIDFQTKHVGTHWALDYNIGRIGQLLGGTFQVYDARGSDAFDIAGNPGDLWITKFLIAPRTGIDPTAGFTDLNNIVVRIGAKFSQTILASGLKTKSDGSINLAAPGQGAAVKSLQINASKFTGMLTTNPLSLNTTGLPQSTDTVLGKTNFFNLAVDINRNAGAASFNGEDAKAILKVPVSKKWVDRNTKKPKP